MLRTCQILPDSNCAAAQESASGLVTKERKLQWMSEVYTFGVKSGQHVAMIDITREVKNLVKESGIKNGICVIYVPHTTAGLTISENADPDIVRDFIAEMNRIIRLPDEYCRRESNSAAHVKSSMVGFSQTIIIEDGQLLMGTWQGIYFMEFDGPQIRKIHVKVIEG